MLFKRLSRSDARRLEGAPRFERLEPRCMLSTSPFNIDDFTSLPPTVDVGAGSLTTILPAGQPGPAGTPNFVAGFDGPVSAADWWSSVAFANNGSPFAFFSHPLAMREQSDGLAIGYPETPFVTSTDYRYFYSEDLRIGLSGLNTSGGSEVVSFSDWTTTLRWQDGADRLDATIGHGLPFVYLTRQGSADALIELGLSSNVWSNSGGVAGVTINGHHYGIFAPTGSTWTQVGNTLVSDLNGADYFSVAVLPDNTQATLDFFRARAFTFVTDTSVSWQYDEQLSTSTATYTAITEQKETGGVNVDQTLLALYRHQWLNSSTPLTSHTYSSSRGDMKLLDGKSFTTTMTHQGVLPVLPELGADQSQLYSYIDQLYQTPTILTTTDTYFTGVEMYKLAQLVPLAEQVGHIAARDRFLFEVRSELEDWFSADDGGAGLFYYDEQWNTLIGYEDSFGSAAALNDHHFHYGYFIQSAAIVAMYDLAWAQESAWGGMVELLIRDVANWERDDNTFEFIRYFDLYAGHGWASGNAQFGRGNNQESSSEAMNFANGLVLWGSVTGDDSIRDLGIHLATTQQAAIEQYWLDVDNVVFPSNYPHTQAGILWSDGASYTTFFSGQPEHIQGINYLPLNGGSLYLGHDTAYVQQTYQHIVNQNGGPVNDWEDLMASYLAFADPTTALANFNANPTDEIQPLAKTYHWISALDALGQVDESITADIASYAVFDKAGVKSYVAYNPSSSAITATFSDGTIVPVPAGTLITTGGNTFSWAPDPSLTPTTPEDQFFVRDQQSATEAGSLSLTAGPGSSADQLTDPNGGVFFDTPVNPVTYTAFGISGVYDPTEQTEFEVWIDALNNSGNMAQVRISYDFEGDGSFDRLEVYSGLALDASNGWQRYDETTGIVSTTGSMQDLVNGTIRLEVWNVFGPGGVQVRTDAASGEGQQSLVDIPFDTVSQGDVLIVGVQDSSIPENGGATIVTVTRNGSTAAALDVTLTSSDVSEAVVAQPMTATIPIGQDSVTFNINAVDDLILDGDQSISFTASAASYADGLGGLLILDNEVPIEPKQTLYLIDGAVAGSVVGTLDTTAGNGAASDLVVINSGNVGTPSNPLVYLREGISAAYNPAEETTFDLYIDAGANIADATQARVSYDFNGDGNFDRIETYNFFATNPIVDWEHYQELSGISSQSGAFADMVNGAVRLELWKSFGGADVEVRTSATLAQGQQSLVSIPFQSGDSSTPGDYNNDNIVNIADYTVWRDSLGASVIPYTSADGDGSGIVDALDYDVWEANFGVNYPAVSQINAITNFSADPIEEEPTTSVEAVDSALDGWQLVTTYADSQEGAPRSENREENETVQSPDDQNDLLLFSLEESSLSDDQDELIELLSDEQASGTEEELALDLAIDQI